ncbi:hypothetical protein CEUSTIGMA_g12278.t1 [Chlamydomonas eustigma]|uniref:Uncharacterized protein n=1 Tax=Chlamydomonas eustigma TaxID=1157962 RepID=A0A250XP57_9CHLO|nr:hypothetical protein CEUSTIGMA_g12278.t1 [Chlamydomonas eustigma]|eukprot:GAX84857.1 hypothetical protein CEUSTIGMA_g12278.t1 [Chlamydomonas eustigma]
MIKHITQGTSTSSVRAPSLGTAAVIPLISDARRHMTGFQTVQLRDTFDDEDLFGKLSTFFIRIPEKAEAYLNFLAESSTSPAVMQKHLLRLMVRGAKLANVLTDPTEGLADIVGDAGRQALLQHLGLTEGGIKDIQGQEQKDLYYGSTSDVGSISKEGQDGVQLPHQQLCTTCHLSAEICAGASQKQEQHEGTATCTATCTASMRPDVNDDVRRPWMWGREETGSGNAYNKKIPWNEFRSLSCLLRASSVNKRGSVDDSCLHEQHQEVGVEQRGAGLRQAHTKALSIALSMIISGIMSSGIGAVAGHQAPSTSPEFEAAMRHPVSHDTSLHSWSHNSQAAAQEGRVSSFLCDPSPFQVGSFFRAPSLVAVGHVSSEVLGPGGIAASAALRALRADSKRILDFLEEGPSLNNALGSALLDVVSETLDDDGHKTTQYPSNTKAAQLKGGLGYLEARDTTVGMSNSDLS